MQGEAGVVGHRYVELLHQLGVVAADLVSGDREAPAQVRPTRAIQGHLHQGLIEGRQEVPEAVDAAAVPKGLGEGLPEGDAHVLVGVVVVDVGVARGADLQIDQAVTADLVEHVIEEGHTGGHLAGATAIEAELHPHVGFPGDAVDLCGAAGVAGGAVLHGGGRVAGLANPIMPKR